MEIASDIYVFTVGIVILVVIGTAAIAAAKAAPWVPTWNKDVGRLIKLVDLKPGELVYDLGAGDGRLIRRIASNYKAHAIGIELSLLPYLYTKVRNLFTSNRNLITLKYGDFFKVDLSKADAIVCFLTPMAMKKLSPKFKRELRPGTRIASFAFPLPDWVPDKRDKPDKKSSPIYVYTIK
ncbi:class I SAM-dependent methyltransferase [Patescibacteria group bacterium]